MQFSVITSSLGRCLAAVAALAALAGLLLLARPGMPAAALTVEGVGPGYITTVAGGGENDPLDGGPANQAKLPSPQKIAVDREGNLYIANNDSTSASSYIFFVAAVDGERFGISMRKGHIYLVGGGSSASLDSSADGKPATDVGLRPSSIALDSAGNIYVYSNAYLLKIDAADGTVEILAGTGSTSTSDVDKHTPAKDNKLPGGFTNVSVDNKGNIFLSANLQNSSLYMIPATSGTYYGIDMTSGCYYQVNANNEEGTSFPIYNRATVDGEGNIYYYRHSRSGFIFNKNTYTNTLGGNHTVIADATNTTEPWPSATTSSGISHLTADADGNVYISFATDPSSSAKGYNCVYQITPTGDINRMVGKGDAINPDNSDDIGDGGPGTLAYLNSPNGFALDGEGNLYIADTRNNRIRYVQLAWAPEPELAKLIIGSEQLLTYEDGEEEYLLAKIFKLTGLDQYGYEFSLSGKSVTWTVLSGPARIEGDALVVTGGGWVQIIAEVEEVQSEPLEFLVSSGPAELTSLDLSGSPYLVYDGSSFDYNLNNLTLDGWDQYRKNISFEQQSVIWAVYAGSDIGSVDGSTLRISGAGTISVCARVYDVRSNDLDLTVYKTPPRLTADLDNNTVGATLTITFPDDPAWRAAITKMSLDGVGLSKFQYSVDEGKITLIAVRRLRDETVLTVEAAGYAEATVAQPLYALLIDGAGVSNPQKFKYSDLTSLGLHDLKYSVINTFPTKKWYTGEGVLLRDLFNQAGLRDTARMLRFTAADGFVVNLTVQELLEKRYYFPGLTENHETAGYIPGSPLGAEEVEAILSLRSSDSDPPHLMIGQRAVTEQNNDAFCKYVSHIEVLTDEPVRCGAPTASVPSGEVPAGTMVVLENDDMDTSKVYYTKDGSEPTLESAMYNWIASRWLVSRGEIAKEINHPINIMQDTVIKAISIGHGKADSEVVTFTYTVPGGSLADPPTLIAAGAGGNILGQAIRLTFADNSAWRSAISDVQVDGKSIDGHYTVSAGAITIDADVFTVATDYTITVSAAGYNAATVTQQLLKPVRESEVTLTKEENKLIVTADTPAAVEITVSAAVSEATVNVAELLGAPQNGVIASSALPELTVNAQVALPSGALIPVRLHIPAGIRVSAAAGWDGTLHLPTLLDNSEVEVIPDRDMSAVVSYVLEIGGDVPLTFDRAVRLAFTGEAGKEIGFSQSGLFAKIDHILETDSQAAGDALTAGGDGKIDVDSDLVVWTKHLTKFVVYTQQNAGGGSGGGSSTTVAAPVYSNGSANVTPSVGATVGLGSAAAVQIPAGALPGSSSVTIRVEEVASPPEIPAGFRLLGQAYEFSVGGQTTYKFAKAVNLIFTFAPTALAEGEIPAVFYYDQELAQWVRLGGTVTGDTIVAAVNHFTKFAVLAADQEAMPVTAAPQQPEAGVVNLTDITGHWAQAQISRLAALGVVNGYPDGSFRPEGTVTRAEFVTMLVKALKPAASGAEGQIFADSASHWAKDYIAVAAANGIVSGYDADTFGPDDLITREQMAVMLVQSASLSSGESALSFTDADQVSAWAREALAAAAEHGLMNGYPDGSFQPQGQATRAEAVTVVVNTM